MIFFSDWQSLFRILVIGVCGYIGIVFILRISGNRTLSKLNNFDFIVTIALGSTFSSGLLQKSVALLDILAAFVVLVGLQYVTTSLQVRFKFIANIVSSDPVLLFADGRFLIGAMNDAKVTKAEVLSGMREQGFASQNDVSFVVLETNGKIVAVGKS